jgi:hypothetical protein
MVDELVALRAFKTQITQYGTHLTKLEAVFQPQTLNLLMAEMSEVQKKKRS